MKRLTVVLLGLAFLLAACAPAADDFSALRQVTVKVRVGDRGNCSGVVIAPQMVLTAAHCAPEGEKLKVLGWDVESAVKNEASDLAILAVPGLTCPCAEVATGRPPLDTKVVVIGFPLNFAQYITEGRLMGAITDPEAPENIRAHFMAISAPIAFGNSGGPVFALVDGRYKVVGIVSAVRGTFAGVVWHLAVVVSTEAVATFTGHQGL